MNPEIGMMLSVKMLAAFLMYKLNEILISASIGAQYAILLFYIIIGKYRFQIWYFKILKLSI